MAGGEYRILYPVPVGPTGDEIRRRAQAGRAFLRIFLGDSSRRLRAFEGCVNDDRVLGIASGDRVVGHASFSVIGKGPLSPTFARFTAEYGLVRGLLGLLVFRMTEPRNDASRLYVYNIQIDKRHRRRGAGSALLDAIEHRARVYSCRTIGLEVSARNAAIALYARKGFVTTSSIRLGPISWLFPIRRLVTMSRALTPPPVGGESAQPVHRPSGMAGRPETSAT